MAGGGGTPRPQWVGHGQGSSAKGDTVKKDRQEAVADEDGLLPPGPPK